MWFEVALITTPALFLKFYRIELEETPTLDHNFSSKVLIDAAPLLDQCLVVRRASYTEVFSFNTHHNYALRQGNRAHFYCSR